MKIEDEIMDFGEWILPTKWEDITLEQWSKIQELYGESEDKELDLTELIHILANKPKEEVKQLPIDFLEKILASLTFLNIKPKEEKPLPRIEIDGVKYEINIMEKMKVGEYIDTTTLIKNDKYNYPMLFGIICRKKNEKYDDDFIADVLPSRIEMFSKQPITNILPLMGFFLTKWNLSNQISNLYSMVEEALNHTHQDITSSIQNGVITKHYGKSLEKRLKGYEKQIKNI